MVTSPEHDEQDPVRPVDLYRHIESWWGADFDNELILRMVKAPREHLEVFQESVDDLKGRLEYTANGIPPGYLRPAVVAHHQKTIQRRMEALRLLLYAHETVLDRDDLFLDFSVLPDYPNILAALLMQIKAMRPFVEDGSIKIAPIESLARQPRFGAEYARVMMQAGEILTEIEEARAMKDSLPFPVKLIPIEALRNKTFSDETSSDSYPMWSELSDESKRFTLYAERFGQLSAACHLAAEHRAHTFARSALDEAVIRAMLQPRMTDMRQVNLQKLAALQVPKITGIDDVVALRKSSADFAEWRNRLGEALTYVGDLSDEESVDEAAEVVYAQLSDGLSQVNAAVKKSPALQAVTGGLAGFAISGISAMPTEHILGNSSIGLVAAASAAGAGAGMLLDSGLTYLKKVNERRKGKLIMDISMLFDPNGVVSD